MGQKVNPHGLRVGVIKNWDSRWYVRDEEFVGLQTRRTSVLHSLRTITSVKL